MLGLLLAAGVPTRLPAQDLELWLDATAAHARAPAGIAGIDPAALGWLGGRLRVDGLGPVDVDAGGYAGSGAEPEDGAWLSGWLAAGSVGWLGRNLAGGRLEAFALRYRRPFSYTARGITLAPRVVRALGPVTIAAQVEVTRGRWSTARREGPDPTGASRGDLTVTGGGITAGRPIGRVWLNATAGVYDARNGNAPGRFGRLGASASIEFGRAHAALDLSRWTTPNGVELAATGAVSVQLDERLVLRAVLDRAVTDPLYGSAGGVTVSFGASWRLAAHRSAGSLPVVEVAEAAGTGRRVRFRLRADDAEAVALTGDFTDWQPRPMARVDDVRFLELVLAPGLYHFGFLLDGGRWFVPEHAPGIVEDGWGRRNASLVVESEE